MCCTSTDLWKSNRRFQCLLHILASYRLSPQQSNTMLTKNNWSGKGERKYIFILHFAQLLLLLVQWSDAKSPSAQHPFSWISELVKWHCMVFSNTAIPFALAIAVWFEWWLDAKLPSAQHAFSWIQFRECLNIQEVFLAIRDCSQECDGQASINTSTRAVGGGANEYNNIIETRPPPKQEHHT